MTSDLSSAGAATGDGTTAPRRARARGRGAFRRLASFAFGTLLALGAGEVAVRVIDPLGRVRFESYFEDADRNRVDYATALARGLVVEPGLPRNRGTWTPGLVFYMCYRDGARPYMDERGCVRVEINALGLRDRADLTVEKPPGVRRVVCIGDSFTFGWGVAEPLVWVRLIEAGLRRRTGDERIATVNCGAAGALYVDEYWWGLRDRFGRLQPDVVLVSLCLNDIALMPNTIALETPAPRRDQPLYLLRMLDALVRPHDRFALDPAVDWGQLLLDLPPDNPAYAAKAETHDMFWGSGGPQAALRAMRAWCREHGAAFGVVVWPLFQNLGRDEHYPFHTLHRVVGEFCATEGIPVLDLFATFHGQRAEELWVDPSDMHGNEKAHALAAPVIEAFVADLLARPR